MKTASPRRRGELLVSLGLLALGICVLIQIQSFGSAEGYEQLGPRLFPYFAGGGLVIVGAILSWQATASGWRNLGPDQLNPAPFDRFAFALINAALILHMALVGFIGFVPASTLLYVLVARAFGSRQWARNTAIGAALSAACFYLFTLALQLNLPASPLRFI